MDGDMPWRLSADLKRFKALTSGKPVIMGRNTWESLPRRPLPKRPNIVISRNTAYQIDDAWLMSSLETAIALGLSKAKQADVDEVFVIGGAKLYEDAISHADTLHVTEVLADPQGDTFFPAFEESDWKEVTVEEVPADDRNQYPTRYRRLERIR